MDEERRNRLSWVAAGALGAFLALVVHAGPLSARRAPSATLEDVKALVHARYVRDVDERDLDDSALRGLAGSLDPYSSYLSPEEARVFRDDTEGSLSGIGIEITLEKGYITVIAPLEDTPAWHAGILPGDRIIEIDGKAHEINSVEEAARLIKGQPGTEVRLTVVHEGASHPDELSITRQKFNVKSVKRPRVLDGTPGVGYVRITQFSPRTADELKAAIDSLLGKGLRALVLDLRSNPGGHLDAAVGVADLFIASGTIVRTVSREASQNRTFDAEEPGTFPPFPMAVLVNGSSASASEIVAGALKDSGRAVVIGTRTYGKGSVQSLIPLGGDGRGEALLKITTARFYTRSGRPIQRELDAKESDPWGIEPDVKVELDVRKLQDIFRKRDAADAREAGAGYGPSVEVPEDPQLAAAVKALEGRVGGGTGTATGTGTVTGTVTGTGAGTGAGAGK